MPNIVYIECRLKGHQLLCEQNATLLPEGGGLLHHIHRCLRCKQTKEFEVEDLDPELDAMLRMTFQPSTHRVVVDLAGTGHKPLLH